MVSLVITLLVSKIGLKHTSKQSVSCPYYYPYLFRSKRFLASASDAVEYRGYGVKISTRVLHTCCESLGNS